MGQKDRVILISGNEACVEGALAAGCRFYAGYPITPQNELTAHMSRRMDEVGGVFIQAESELAAINMVYGAAAAGACAMTSSSSPGISLKQEGISFLAACRLPAVIVNVARGGPGLGNIAPSQADYFQATRGGGHGDYRCLVLAPASAQEMFSFTAEAFALAQQYRIPVIILADGMIGQMMEPVRLHAPLPERRYDRSWVLNGAKNRPGRCVKSLYLKEGGLETLNNTLQGVYRTIEREQTRVEIHADKNAPVHLVAYGLSYRIARAVAQRLSGLGMKIGLIKPVTLWPFPYEAVRKAAGGTGHLVVLEMSAGQMVEDVRLALGDDRRVHFHGRTGGGIPAEDEVVTLVRDVYETAAKNTSGN